jgi:hypothetical protein
MLLSSLPKGKTKAELNQGKRTNLTLRGQVVQVRTMKMIPKKL